MRGSAGFRSVFEGFRDDLVRFPKRLFCGSRERDSCDNLL